MMMMIMMMMMMMMMLTTTTTTTTAMMMMMMMMMRRRRRRMPSGCDMSNPVSPVLRTSVLPMGLFMPHLGQATSLHFLNARTTVCKLYPQAHDKKCVAGPEGKTSCGCRVKTILVCQTSGRHLVMPFHLISCQLAGSCQVEKFCYTKLKQQDP